MAVARKCAFGGKTAFAVVVVTVVVVRVLTAAQFVAQSAKESAAAKPPKKVFLFLAGSELKYWIRTVHEVPYMYHRSYQKKVFR